MENLVINRTRLQLPSNQYIPERTAKDLIVLHFTAGLSAASAFTAWNSTKERVATAYLVDLDGAVYEVFPPEMWAPHLGVPGPDNANWILDRRSIGIEIVNPGGLKPAPGNPQVLNWWPNSYRTRYCSLAETGRYAALPYRGFKYFAAFPEKQIDAVVQLVTQLCQTFRIPQRFPAEPLRSACDLKTFATYSGIASHQNFLAEKTDIGPAFPWERLTPGERLTPAAP
jgi:N-acetyl-anhydromuramyl-L-alanine amidase AmpD